MSVFLLLSHPKTQNMYELINYAQDAVKGKK